MSLEFFQSLSTYSESLIAKKLKKIKDGHSILVLISNPFTKSSIILCFPCTIKGNQSGVWFQKTAYKVTFRPNTSYLVPFRPGIQKVGR